MIISTKTLYPNKVTIWELELQHILFEWHNSSHSKNNFSACWELSAAAAAAKSLQSCRTLWDPIDGSPPGFPVPGILKARTLEWVAISFSNAWKWKVKVKSLSRVQLLATPWTAAHQAPPSMGFSRQEYWSGLPLPSLWELSTGGQMESQTWKEGKTSHRHVGKALSLNLETCCSNSWSAALHIH